MFGLKNQVRYLCWRGTLSLLAGTNLDFIKVGQNVNSDTNSQILFLEKHFGNTVEDVKISHTRISNLNMNIVKNNNNMDVNEFLPISDCKSLADNKLPERVTDSRPASRTRPCVDLMVKNIPRVANHIYGPRIVENGVRNYFDNCKNTLYSQDLQATFSSALCFFTWAEKVLLWE